MSEFKVGDRVRYLGTTSFNAKAIGNRHGTVLNPGSRQRYADVSWDNDTRPTRSHAVNKLELVPPIDWDAPIELDDGTPLNLIGAGETFAEVRLIWCTDRHKAFPGATWTGLARRDTGIIISNHSFYVRNRKTMSTFTKGDRVRYTGKSRGNHDPKMIGQLGTVTEFERESNVYVVWDNPENHGTNRPDKARGVFSSNLEWVGVQIDPTKPLELVAPGGCNRPAVFITLTNPEGHILVTDTHPQKASAWLMFDRQGKFVRSDKIGACGSDLKLVNKVEDILRFTPICTNGRPFYNTVYKSFEEMVVDERESDSGWYLKTTVRNGQTIDAVIGSWK